MTVIVIVIVVVVMIVTDRLCRRRLAAIADKSDLEVLACVSLFSCWAVER